MYTKISSFQNPQIKKLIKLQTKARERKKSGLFVLEGKRELLLALQANYSILQIFFTADLFDINSIKDSIGKSDIYEIETALYAKIAYRKSTEGVIALAQTKEHILDNLKLSKNPFVLVAEAPEKPGNIGAILRTADAANVDAVFIANPKTDLYNPNLIRSSVGCVFTNQIATGSTEAIIAFLQKHGIAIYCAALTGDAVPYYHQDYTRSSAIVVGTEATGLSKTWLQNATKNIIIPMRGKIDSMNVSVATGILVFEAIRQRTKK